MRRLATAAALVLLLGSCGCEEEARPPAPSAEDDPVAPGEEPAEAPPAGLPRVRYDLAAHVARAELRQGGALVVDFGVPGGAKHTLGGWQTRVGRDRVIDGTTVTLIEGVTGKVLLPTEREGPQVLTLRARAFGDGRLTVYVDDETVHHAVLPADGAFAIVTVPLSAEQLGPGEHFLSLRVPRVGSVEGVPGIGRAGIALDWLKLSPGSEPPPESAPAAPDALARRLDDATALVLPPATSLGWALEVPEGARLRGRLRTGSGSLRVVAERDGAPPAELARFDPAEATREVDVDLSPVAGRFVRLVLEAVDAEQTLLSPAVVTLDAPEGEPATLRRPRNVLVYLIDTLRTDKLRPYAPDTRVQTPGLTGWAGHATRFARGQSQENWTKPSVATLLSGLMPWEHQTTGEDSVLPGSVTMVSELLGDRGFYTGAFIANGFVSHKFGFRQGWSTFRNYIREGRRTQASFVAADVLAWLDERPEDQPFFLYVHTIDPHVPYIPPDDILARYDPDPYDGPVSFTRDRETLEKIKSGALRVNARDRLRLEALYDGEITYHDTHMAAILEGLARRGLDEDTMVVVTSDHGEEFFDHDSVGHGHSVWQELLHVPLFVRVPGLTEGSAPVPDAVGLVDVVPTMLEALGEPLPEGLAGRSFLPLLRGDTADAPRVAVSGFMRGWRTVVVGRFKLIQRTASHLSLYDLGADPDERRDLAPERPLTVRCLRGLLGLALSGGLHGSGTGATVHEAESTDLDPETEAQLRALGYVGASRPR